MGKTAVWLETVAAAGGRGHRVLQARPAESEAGLAYSVITDLIGGVFDDVRITLPPPQSRALAAALLRSDPEQPIELRAVATAFVTVLLELTAEQPIVVAIDDVQWIDPSSERVLGFVARRLPAGIGLLMALRQDGDKTPSRFVQAVPKDLLERVVLAPLSSPALHHLVQDRIGASVTRPMLARLSAASGGNPLFALEIGRALMAQTPAWAPHDPLPVPSTLQHLVATRVDALSEQARDALLVAATLSRPTATAIGRAVESSGGMAALTEALEADVIVSEHGRIRFTHPLLASAIYGSASARTRTALHQRLADVVDEPEERARHLASGTEIPDARASAELETAATHAAWRGAQDTAADLFAAASRLTPGDACDDHARRSLGQADALNALGEFAAARALAERALNTTRSPNLRTKALSLLANIAWFNGAAGTAIHHAEEALSVTGLDRALRGGIHAQLVRLCFSWDLRSAIEHADLAMKLLREDREPATLAHVLIDRLFGSALRGEAPPGGLLDRALALEVRSLAENDAPHPMPLLWFHCTDEFESARRRFAMEGRWYGERGEEVWVADRLSHLAVAELHAGDWDSAESHVEESCAAVEELAVRGPRAMVFEKRALVDAHRGRIERARTTLRRLIAEYESMDQGWWAALSLSSLAFVEFAASDHRAADAALVRMRALADLVGAVDVLFDRSEPFHIEALLALGEIDRARATLERLEQRGRRLPRPWISVTLPRARALIAAADGDLVTALAELRSTDVESTTTLPFERGWTLLVRGRIERRAKQKSAAATSLRQALDQFQTLGAPLFAERARQELTRVGLRHAASGLTPTELLIARYAARGMTNREVAQAAFVSQKTVEANLAKAYRKLGIHSRAELGSHMAADQGDRPTEPGSSRSRMETPPR